MKEKKLIIYGIGKLAEYVKYVFEEDTDFKVISFCIQRDLHKSSTFLNLPLVPFDDLEEQFPPDSYSLFIAVGHNEVRKRIFEEAQTRNYNLPNYISSKANTWKNLKVGQNCFIGEGSTIQPFVEIGNSCILFAANIGHHTTIGNHVLVSAMTLGGNVQVEDNCFLGMNSTIAQNVKVGQNSIVGMGCSISRNTAPNSVYTAKGTLLRNLSSEMISKQFLR